MPLQKLALKSGVNRESTTLANEGGYFDSEKIRFRSGSPEKIGGWITDTGTTPSVLQPPTNAAPLNPASFWGVCRSLWSWLTLSSYNLMALGTHLKFYIQNGVGGDFYDVTPIRLTTAAGDVTFAAVNGSTTLTITDTAHGAQANDFVTFSDAVSLGGVITAAILNAEFQIVSSPTVNTYTILSPVAANGADSGNGGVAVVGAYQINTGAEYQVPMVGWSAGAWGAGVWGVGGTGTATTALRLWSENNFGENLVMNPRGGALYLWAVNATPLIFDRAQLLGPSVNITTKDYATGTGSTTTAVDSSCPLMANFVRVSDSSRFIFAFGCNDYGSAAQTPMLIRWSDQESFATWLPAATNQAGSYTLSQGSTLITAVQTRQELLVFTDSALYSTQYLGPPYVWGFQLMESNISIAGPNAVVTANNLTYWMGVDKFYVYSGRVETLPCTLRQYVFNDINMSQQSQVFAGTNEGYNEIWWYYCSTNSTTIDKYVIYNYLEKTWYYGTMSRTAWVDSQLREQPVSAGYGGQMIYQETGVDDGTTTPASPIVSYVQSSDFDIGDGNNYGFVWRMIPDVTFDGSTVNNPTATFTLRPRQNPGANYGVSSTLNVVSTQNYVNQKTYNVQQFTEIVYTRVRGRQMALKIGSTELGVAWHLGVPRLDSRPDGRR